MLVSWKHSSACGLALAALLISCAAAHADKCAKTRVKTVGARKAAKMNIVDTAVSAGSFKTLATAIEAAGLIDTLKSAGPFTVFAPTDAAFAKLPEGTVEALLKDKDKLTAVLTYHVVAGNVKAADVIKLDKAKTIQGEEIMIDASNGVKINNANVVKADVDCTNGVIHVIDTVLLPKE